MAEKKTPQPKEWWFADNGTGRVYICGLTQGGVPICQARPGDDVYADDEWEAWHHEPRCTGWDWVPPVVPDPGEGYRLIDKTKDTPEPGDEYWTRGGGWIPRADPEDPFTSMDVYRRKVKPVSPPEPSYSYVTQDRVPARPGIDQRRWVNSDGMVMARDNDWTDCEGSVADSGDMVRHGYEYCGSRLELRCLRKDLPEENPPGPPNCTSSWTRTAGCTRPRRPSR